MEDQSSAKAKAQAKAQAQALLSTIGTKDDPAEVFFGLLPTPEEIHGVTNADTHDSMNKRFANVLDAVNLFLQKHVRESEDPDFAYIFTSVAEATLKEPKSWMKCLRNSLAYVALMNSRDGEASSQGTKKDRLLAYYLWRLHGAKDETSPTHKPSCREARALRRATTIFTEIWFEDLRLRNGWDIESVTEENGLIEMKIMSEELCAYLGRVPFRPRPRHLVESEEQVLACVSAGTCEDVVEGGRLFFELFIRQAVHFQPKNAHKTVHTSYPNGKHEFLFIYFHVVFRITLPSGMRFAFDPTGAQNGWQEYLAPWDAYEQHRIHFIKDTRVVDARGLMECMGDTERDEMVIATVVAVVEGSLGRRLLGGGLEELLYSLSDARFETKRESLVKAFRELFMSIGTDVD
ncbi:hypothetical protein SLS64_006424 [Diaporthe eres]|uniref:HNH nuclease domain-containing protein n=1 Tax=Diaporthe eres TaxID=83184 RepID=A0ABR1P9R2_DIAER